MTQIQHVLTLPALPVRPADGHKGTFGHVLILAGSRGMSGAAVLSGISALRGGAGLVTLGVPMGLQPIVSSAEASYLTEGFPEDESGRFESGVIKILANRLEKYSAIGIGPGWGQTAASGDLARWLFATSPVPLVIDADALNLLAGKFPDRETEAPRILTPHPGEFSRLTGKKTTEVQSDRQDLAARFALENNVILLLKGSQTIVTDGKRLAINSTGNSGMGTGGCGDVLTGLLTSLLGQGMEGFEAAQLAAHLHGLAGDLAAQELSQPGMIASDLPRFLCEAWKVAGAK